MVKDVREKIRDWISQRPNELSNVKISVEKVNDSIEVVGDLPLIQDRGYIVSITAHTIEYSD